MVKSVGSKFWMKMVKTGLESVHTFHLKWKSCSTSEKINNKVSTSVMKETTITVTTHAKF